MLEVNNLRITLEEKSRERNIVEGISFSLPRGTSLGIVGESGSGNTITALSILKLLPPGIRISGGDILLLESPPDKNLEIPADEAAKTTPRWTDLASIPEKQMQFYRGGRISMIFQEPMTSLNPSMRCGKQVAEAVETNLSCSRRQALEKARCLLEEVRLPAGREFLRKYPHQLSGGQRQRIMIAMALAGNPDLLIADEPTTALDVRVQKKILELLKDIRLKRQMSMLFISHDLGVVRQVCENALVMYEGTIAESGRVNELFKKPGHPYTRGLIACRPSPVARPLRLPTLADFLEPTSLPSDGPARPSPETKEEAVPHADERNQNQDPLLEVRNLSVEYARFRAVDKISFRIFPGETLGLIGESGCGKTSLGKSVIRLIRSGEGEVLFRGRQVSSLKGKDLNSFRQKVQFLFQDPFSSLNPRIAVGPSIIEIFRVHGIHREKARRKKAVLDLLGKVGLEPGHFSRYPHEFSGGQRQRIGLARALATGPELIILDESVSSLDVSVQAMILNLLNDLKDSFRLTYLYISHDLSVVKYMSDRILVMKDGRLVEEGTGEEIFTRPSTDYTRELIESIPS